MKYEEIMKKENVFIYKSKTMSNQNENVIPPKTNNN